MSNAFICEDCILHKTVLLNIIRFWLQRSSPRLLSYKILLFYGVRERPNRVNSRCFESVLYFSPWLANKVKWQVSVKLTIYAFTYKALLMACRLLLEALLSIKGWEWGACRHNKISCGGNIVLNYLGSVHNVWMAGFFESLLFITRYFLLIDRILAGCRVGWILIKTCKLLLDSL